MSATSTFTCDACGVSAVENGAGKMPKGWQRVFMSNRPGSIWDNEKWTDEMHVCDTCLPPKPETHPEPTPAAKRTLLERALAVWRR